MTVNVTLGGRASGALPIFERHWVEVENRDVCGRCANAGTRKAGSVVSRKVAGDGDFRMALDERMQCRVASMMSAISMRFRRALDVHSCPNNV